MLRQLQLESKVLTERRGLSDVTTVRDRYNVIEGKKRPEVWKRISNEGDRDLQGKGEVD